MDDLIEKFFESYYTEELRELFYKALGVFTIFGYTSVHQQLQDVIMQEQEVQRETVIGQVYETIEEGLDKLLKSNRLQLTGEASFSLKIKILEAIFSFSYREDYLPYAKILEGQDTDEEKFVAIISDLSGIDEPTLLTAVEWVYEGTIQLMKEFVAEACDEENKTENLDQLRIIRKNLRAYESAFGTPGAVVRLASFDMVKGMPFDSYLSLFENEVIDLTDLETTTFNLIWLALISEEGIQNPQKLLLERVDRLFGNFKDLNTFSSMLQKAMGRFQEFKDHQK